jgi:hypothetical protein
MAAGTIRMGPGITTVVDWRASPTATAARRTAVPEQVAVRVRLRIGSPLGFRHPEC